MKLQLQGQQVRARLDEAELARLLAGDPVVNCTQLGAAGGFSQQLTLGSGAAPSLVVGDDAWHIELPRAEVTAYAGHLPCRQALVFAIALGDDRLELAFEVDVRDSMKIRGARRRGKDPAQVRSSSPLRS